MPMGPDFPGQAIDFIEPCSAALQRGTMAPAVTLQLQAMKLSKKLSPSIVEACRPESAPYRLWDTTVPQLHLRVQPSGVKSWNVQWSRTSTRALGKWPGVTVESARAKAKAVLVETDRLGAPLAVVEAAKPKASTLGEFIAGAYASWARGHLKDGATNINRMDGGYALRIPLDAIAEMHRVLRPGGVALVQDLSRDASPAAIDDEVQHMNLGRANAFVTKLILGTFLRRRAYTTSQLRELAGKSPFGACDIRHEGIGFELRLAKRSA